MSAIYDALVELLGQPSGKQGGRSFGAFRRASKALADAGVEPEALDRLLRDYAIASLQQTGPTALASYLAGRLRVSDRRLVSCQRWPNECIVCSSEIGRGELCWLRKGDDDAWQVTCSDCEEIDPSSERAANARKLAMERDSDPDSLLVAILAHSPSELREEIEDDLSLGLEASRG